MVLVIDNYDSFTYNLVQYLGELGADLRVFRNDEISLDQIGELQPERIVISPGPGRPEDAGITTDVIRRFGPTTPILGVCLGHQAIGMVYGGTVCRAKAPMHGKTSTVVHDGKGVFQGIGGEFQAGRYHSLVIASGDVPVDLEVAARTRDHDGEGVLQENVIMAVRHVRYPVHGVQFHPESVLTGEGRRILKNFLDI
jgi:anthranilate synthase/aminodeoxychorismate synthase-like glutamine amidotransferase